MTARLSRLPGDIVELLAVRGGVFTVRQARERGVTLPRLRRLERAGLLIRLANGVYGSRASHDDGSPWRAFALRSKAFALACGPRAHAAGWSAVAIRGLPTLGPPPLKPHVIVPVGAGSATNSRFGEVRAVTLPPEHRAMGDACPIVTDARVVVDVARTAPREDALVLADAVLASGTTVEQLHDVLEAQRFWPGLPGAAWVIEHADGYAESALETLGRLAFIEHDLPVPISNAWLDVGPVRFWPDHLLDDRWLIFEGDGDLKYNGRLDAAAVIREQREREWMLRESGLEIARYGWREARHRRGDLAARAAAMIAARPPRPRACHWYREVQTYRRAA